MPNGRRKEIYIDRPKDIENKAHILQKAGWSFEIEMLSTGTISMEICRKNEDWSMRTLSSKLCDNSPGIEKAVDEMVEEAYNNFINKK